MTRSRAERAGRRAEAVAAWWLRCKGYRVVARRSRQPGGELDLVVRRGRVLAFVEVKLRATPAAAAEAILPAQRARIARAAQSFVARDSRLHGLDQRFDVMLFAPRRLPVHIPNAWHILT